jgi:SAM-dependent methyltransferase
MITSRKLPPDFLSFLKSIETSYLNEKDPIRQSGFGGGPVRWREEREPLLKAIEKDGNILDVCCANGFLLECLIKWSRELGIVLTPYGLDIGRKLIKLAQERFPQYKSNFHVGNSWNWKPSKQFKYVYSLYDCVPLEFLEEYIYRLLSRMVCPGGKLILGAYGSRSKGTPPFDIEDFLQSCGYSVDGVAEGGNPTITLFAWLVKK